MGGIQQHWLTASQHALVELMFKDGTVWRKRLEQARLADDLLSSAPLHACADRFSWRSIHRL
jgi:hypothetical protein